MTLKILTDKFIGFDHVTQCQPIWNFSIRFFFKRKLNPYVLRLSVRVTNRLGRGEKDQPCRNSRQERSARSPIKYTKRQSLYKDQNKIYLSECMCQLYAWCQPDRSRLFLFQTLFRLLPDLIPSSQAKKLFSEGSCLSCKSETDRDW